VRFPVDYETVRFEEAVETVLPLSDATRG